MDLSMTLTNLCITHNSYNSYNAISNNKNGFESKSLSEIERLMILIAKKFSLVRFLQRENDPLSKRN